MRVVHTHTEKEREGGGENGGRERETERDERQRERGKMKGRFPISAKRASSTPGTKTLIQLPLKETRTLRRNG
jgi:hypothetical protein